MRQEDWTFLVGIVVVFALTVSGLAALAASRCAGWSKSMNVVTEWNLTTGCLIKQPDGTFVPASMYRVVK